MLKSERESKLEEKIKRMKNEAGTGSFATEKKH